MYKKSLVFLASCFGMLIFGITLITLGSILPSLTATFGLDEIAAGALLSLLPIGILCGSIVFGPIVDRYGYKILLIVCALLVMLGLEGISYAKEFFVLQLSIFLIGFGGGVINGGTNALVADISTEGKGANLSLLGVFFGVGALGMPIILGLLSKGYAYSQILRGVGLFVALPVLLLTVIQFPTPKHPQSFPFKQTLSLFKESTLVLMGIFLFFESGVEGIVNNWTTTFLQTELKVEAKDALFGLSCFVIALTLMRLILGSLLKRIKPHKILMLSIGLAIVGSLTLLNVTHFLSALVGLALLGIGFAAGFPVILGDVGERYATVSGTAFSMVFTIALVGNTLINYATGYIAHLYGIRQFSMILVVCLVIMSLLLWFISKRLHSNSAS